MPPVRFDKRIHNYYWGSPPSIWGNSWWHFFPQFFFKSAMKFTAQFIYTGICCCQVILPNTARLPDGLAAAEKG
jgi:hypothetical protein